MVGQQVFAGEATRLAYGTEEAAEGRSAFVEKRKADFSKFLATTDLPPTSDKAVFAAATLAK